MTTIELQKIADESYAKYIDDDSIIGFDSILKLFGGGTRRRNKIRNLIYDKYGKENLIKIYRHRLAKSAHKNRTVDSYHISPEQREKMKCGIKKSWENNNERKQLHRQLIIKNCCPKSHTENTNKKRIISRKNGKGWKLHSDYTKNKLSTTFKNKWKNGDYDTRPKCIKSKGQLELFDLLKNIDNTVIAEFRVYDKPFDICIPEKKLLFEFNGTYWHLDPREYDANYYDKYRQLYAYQIWKKDFEKYNIAKKYGYDTIVIWQIDWDLCKDKQKYLIEVINGFNN